MAADILEGREILTSRLKNQLGVLVNSVEIAGQNNLSSSHVVAETTLAGLLNLVYGWELVNANAIRQNCPGVDLIDEDRKIAVQVTSTRTVEKVRHTLEEVGKSGVIYKKLIILTITNAAPTDGMKNCTVPTYSGPMEVWNISDVFRVAKELDAIRLGELTKYMEAELGPIRERVKELPHLELPPVSALPPTAFVGREPELAEIQSRFARGDRQVFLTGLGGMGKTELAAHYGMDHPGLVYFVRFDTGFTRTLAGMVHGIRPKLQEEELRLEESILVKKVLTLLERSGPDDLLIIDNVDSDTATLSELQQDPGYQAILKLPLKLLMTTRSDVPRAVSVEAMPDETLFKIFQKHGADLSEPEMTDLIRAVSGHTLTVDLMARTLNGKGWRKVTAEKMLSALRENSLRDQKYRKIATDYNQSTDQAQIYGHLSVVFDLSGMPELSRRVLGFATLLPEGGMEGECFGMSLPEEEQDALDALLDHGWLEMQDDRLTIHPVIRLVCRTEQELTEADCAAFLDKLWEQYDQKQYRPDRYTQMAELFALAHDRLGTRHGRWLNRSGILLNDIDPQQKLYDLYHSRLPALEKSLPENSTELATAYNYYGISLGQLGRYQEALEYSQKALAIQEKVLPREHPDLATSYNNVGCTYGNLGNHHKALDYHLKDLAILEKVLPQEHPHLAISYDNVGGTYGNLGNHHKALDYKLKALAILEKVLPQEHPDLATSYNNVGLTYGNLGNHHKELEYQLKALAIREKVLPPEHPYLATSCNNIAWTYHEMGEFLQAAPYMRRAADIIERSDLPRTHPDRINYPKWAAELEKKAEMQRKLLAHPIEPSLPPFPFPFGKK